MFIFASQIMYKAVKDLLKYWIEFIGLENRVHDFQYIIDDRFFKNFDGSEIKKGSLSCLLHLNKTDNFIDLDFNITGSVELICDRSLDVFEHVLDIKKHMLLKYGEENKEIDDEIEIISRNRQGINIAQYIYEFIAISIPMKKLHPRYSEVENMPQENELLYSSSPDDIKDSQENEENIIDPRWEALRKLKNKFN